MGKKDSKKNQDGLSDEESEKLDSRMSIPFVKKKDMGKNFSSSSEREKEKIKVPTPTPAAPSRKSTQKQEPEEKNEKEPELEDKDFEAIDKIDQKLGAMNIEHASTDTVDAKCKVCGKKQSADVMLFQADDNQMYCHEHFASMMLNSDPGSNGTINPQATQAATILEKEKELKKDQPKAPIRTPFEPEEIKINIVKSEQEPPRPTSTQTQTIQKSKIPLPIPPEVGVKTALTMISEKFQGTEYEGDVQEFLDKYNHITNTKEDFFKNKLKSFWSGKQQEILERGMLTLPPITQFVMVVVDFVRDQIEIEHPVATYLKINIRNNKAILRHPILRRILPAFRFTFYIKNSEMLNYMLNISIVQLENLGWMLRDNNIWNTDTRFWVETSEAFIDDFKYRNNVFTDKFTTITNSPDELQKLFQGVETCLTKLAAVEARITQNAYTKYIQAFQSLSNDDRQKVIVDNFQKFDAKWVPDLAEEFKQKVFFLLLQDEEIVLKPAEVLALFSKFNQNNREQFLKMLGQTLLPVEYDLVIPQLKQMRGQFNAGMG